MARFSRIETLNAFYESKLVVLFYEKEINKAKGILKACARAGARILEFTNRGDRAHEIFKELELFAKEEHPNVILGAGSVTDPETAALYTANGANFIVGPSFNENLARFLNRKRIAYMPGCETVTEIQNAEEMGCEIIKLFPAGTKGPSYIKAVLGPMPNTAIMPTGGIKAEKESIKEWFNAGAVCLAMGSKLIKKDLILANDFNGIEKDVSRAIALIKEMKT